MTAHEDTIAALEAWQRTARKALDEYRQEVEELRSDVTILRAALQVALDDPVEFKRTACKALVATGNAK